MGLHNNLYLHEEILLLALRDHEGTIAPGTMYQYAIGGAILAELLLSEYISVEEYKKRKLVNLDRFVMVDDPLIAECLEKVKNAKRRAALQTWVSRFAGVKNLKHRVAQQLCRKGILKDDEDTVLLFFKRKIYPEVNPEPERKLTSRIREAILSDSAEVDPRTTVLISLTKSTGILKLIFDKKQLKERKARIEQIINGDVLGNATKESIEAMQAAVLATTISATIITTTVSN